MQTYKNFFKTKRKINFGHPQNHFFIYLRAELKNQSYSNCYAITPHFCYVFVLINAHPFILKISIKFFLVFFAFFTVCYKLKGQNLIQSSRRTVDNIGVRILRLAYKIVHKDLGY